MNKIGIIEDVQLFDHKINERVHETPDRLKQIYFDLKKLPFADKLIKYSCREINSKELLSVHSQFFIDQVKNACVNSNPYSYDKDTYFMEDSFYVAKHAAGGCLNLADAIMNNEINRGFALIRPPGHHADVGRAQGFCILNNIAITAKYLKDKFNLQRILIIDFDVHHGNGTQEIFYDSDDVMLVSIHQKNLFPHNSGNISEFGKNNGLGYNINIPLESNYGDNEYIYIFGKIIQNIMEQYMPQIILVSAGFDAHEKENISQMKITTSGFHKITEILKYFSQEYSDNKLLYILEGGYNLKSLKESVYTSLKSLSCSKVVKQAFPYSEKIYNYLKTDLNPIFQKKWHLL